MDYIREFVAHFSWSDIVVTTVIILILLFIFGMMLRKMLLHIIRGAVVGFIFFTALSWAISFFGWPIPLEVVLVLGFATTAITVIFSKIKID